MDSVPAVHIMNWASAAREGCWGDASICIWTHAMAKCGASPHKPHTVWQGGRATAVVRMRAPAFAQGRRPAEVAEFMELGHLGWAAAQDIGVTRQAFQLSNIVNLMIAWCRSDRSDT
jgi:hypothetical protein